MPKTIDEAIRKAKLCYLLFKQRSKLSRNWKYKKNEKMDQCRKGYKPSPFRKGTRSHTDNNYNKSGSIINNGTKGTGTSNSGWNNNKKEIKCLGCNGSHLYKNCPHNPNRKMDPVKMLQEYFNVNDIAMNIPIINVVLED